jgi:hypothetical protein
MKKGRGSLTVNLAPAYAPRNGRASQLVTIYHRDGNLQMPFSRIKSVGWQVLLKDKRWWIRLPD